MPLTLSITSTTVIDGGTSSKPSYLFSLETSEATADFVEGDVTVTNGSIAGFAGTNGTVYTGTITPTSAGEVTIAVAAAAFTNADGDDNEAASFTFTYELPTLLSMRVLNSDGEDIASGRGLSPFSAEFVFSEAPLSFPKSALSLFNATSAETVVDNNDPKKYTAAITEANKGEIELELADGQTYASYDGPSIRWLSVADVKQMREETIGRGIRYVFGHKATGGDGSTALTPVVIAMPKNVKDFTYAYDREGAPEISRSKSQSRRQVTLSSGAATSILPPP